MTRTIRGNTLIKRRRKILKFTKSFYGAQSKIFSVANQRYMKSKLYSYADRKKKKRINKKLWINQLSCKLKVNFMKYNITIKKLKENKINLNRKQLSKLSLIDSETFKILLSLAKS